MKAVAEIFVLHLVIFTYLSKCSKFKFNDSTGKKAVLYHKSYLCFVDNLWPLDNTVKNGLSTTKDVEQLTTCQTNIIKLVKNLLLMTSLAN